MQTRKFSIEPYCYELASSLDYTPCKIKTSENKIVNTTTASLNENPEGQMKTYFLTTKQMSTPPKRMKLCNYDYTVDRPYSTELLSSPIKKKCTDFMTFVKPRKNAADNLNGKSQEMNELKKKLFEKSIELECLKELTRIYHQHFLWISSVESTNSILFGQITQSPDLINNLSTIIIKSIITGYNDRDAATLFKFIVNAILNK